MNIYRWLILLLVPTLITLTSCGSDDDNSDSAQSEEETTTGTTGTTTGTTTGDDGTSCMTATQRNNIRSLFDRAVSQSPIEGRAVEAFRNPDGTFDTTVYPKSTIEVKRTSDNSWQSDSTYCVAEGEGCSSAQHVYSIAGECYVEDGLTGKIKSSSPNRLSVALTDTNTTPPLKQDVVYQIPGNGRARINVIYTLNGLRNSTFNFLENPEDTGTTTGGETGATTGP